MRLFSNEDTLMAFRGQNVAEISFCVHSQSIRLHNLCGLSLRNNAHISCTPSRPAWRPVTFETSHGTSTPPHGSLFPLRVSGRVVLRECDADSLFKNQLQDDTDPDFSMMGSGLLGGSNNLPSMEERAEFIKGMEIRAKYVGAIQVPHARGASSPPFMHTHTHTHTRRALARSSSHSPRQNHEHPLAHTPSDHRGTLPLVR
jgi:hypothetical protein